MPAGPTTHASAFRRHVFRAARLVLGLAIVTWIFNQTGWKAVGEAILRCDPVLLALVLPVVLLIQLSGALRVQWLLADQSCSIGYGTALRTTLIGIFIGMALFGTVGGDTARMYLFSQSSNRASLVRVAFALVADRVCGLAALGAIVLLTSISAGEAWLTSSPGKAAVAASLLVITGGAAVIAFSFWDRGMDGLLARFVHCGTSASVEDDRGRLRSRPRWARALNLSIWIHVLAAIGGMLVVYACRLDVHTFEAAAIVSTTTLALAVPLTPLGLGVREGSLIALFHVAGVTDRPSVLAVAALSMLPQLLTGAMGAVAYAAHRLPVVYSGAAPLHSSESERAL